MAIQDRRRPKHNPLLLPPHRGNRTRGGEDDQSHDSHRLSITHMVGKARFNPVDGSGDQYAALVGESGQKSADIVGSQLIDMRRNHTPGALYHKLNEEAPLTSKARE